ncbi:UNKNOWN [Stylonychia lemnae]|uniref:Uncharacterized protein n=1 Tax=Stylonychia lemnae TaxID=5949 RepID=A0A078AP10_STYLE|nr:UNKNOWN [Stylonychia lemnae]|eukprot:CDW83052.1 UNKNOWN [Stylonychia lemnae]
MEDRKRLLIQTLLDQSRELNLHDLQQSVGTDTKTSQVQSSYLNKIKKSQHTRENSLNSINNSTLNPSYQDLIVNQHMQIQHLNSSLMDKDHKIKEITEKLQSMNQYTKEVDQLKSQLLIMEKLVLQENKSQVINKRNQSILFPTQSHSPNIKTSSIAPNQMLQPQKMNAIDDDDQVFIVDQMRLPSPSQKLNLQKIKQKGKSSITSITDLYNLKMPRDNMLKNKDKSLKENSQVDKAQNCPQKLKARVQVLVSEKKKLSSEILPELREQLSSMKENLGEVEKEIEGEKIKNMNLYQQQDNILQEFQSRASSFKNVEDYNTQLKQAIVEQETKNYEIIKENLKYKEVNSKLMEELRIYEQRDFQNDHEIQKFSDELQFLLQKINVKMSETQKLEGFQQIRFLIQSLDYWITDALDKKRQLESQKMIQDEKISTTTENSNFLQKIIDKNQELIVDQLEKIKKQEEVIRQTKHDLNTKIEQEKQIDRQQIALKNLLVNLCQQIDSQLFKNSCKQSKQDFSLEQHIEQLNKSIQEMIAKLKDLDMKFHQQVSETQEVRDKMLCQIQYDKNNISQVMMENQKKLDYFQGENGKQLEIIHQLKIEKQKQEIESENKIRKLEQNIQEMSELQILIKDILCKAFTQIRNVILQKQYLSQQSIKQEMIVEGYESLFEDHYTKKLKGKSIFIKIRKIAIGLIFIRRLRRLQQNKNKDGDSEMKKRIYKRVLDNYMNNRDFWEITLVQSTQFKYIQQTLEQLNSCKEQFTNFIYSTSQQDKQDQDNYFIRLFNQLQQERELIIGQEQQLVNIKNQLEISEMKNQRYHEESIRQFEQNERLSHQLNSIKSKSNQILEEENSHLQKCILEFQDQMREKEQLYSQKIQYLRRDIELKEHQIDSLKKLMKIKGQNDPQAIQHTLSTGQISLGRISSRGSDKIHQVNMHNESKLSQAKKLLHDNFNYSFSENV